MEDQRALSALGAYLDGSCGFNSILVDDASCQLFGLCLLSSLLSWNQAKILLCGEAIR
jgi:hypothetical protein